jgi:hypothetical protein
MTTEPNGSARPLSTGQTTPGTAATHTLVCRADYPRPAPSLAQILAGWQAQGKIEIIPLTAVAAELTHGRLSPLGEET